MLPTSVSEIIELPCIPADTLKRDGTPTTGDVPMLPRTPGIYFVIGADQAVLYIGTSKKLRQRWRAHARTLDSIEAGASIHWIEVDQGREEAETRLIEHFKPAWHHATVTNKAPETHASQFGRTLVSHRRTKPFTCPECGRRVTVRVHAETCGRSACRSRRYRRLKRQEQQT